MFERFTRASRQVVVSAQQEARALEQHQVGPEHLLLGVLAAGDNPGADALVASGVHREAARATAARLVPSDAEALAVLGIDLDQVRSRAEARFGPGALQPRPPAGLLDRLRGRHQHFTPGAKQALERALRDALQLRHDYIGPEHILLGIVADDATPAATLLRRLNVEPAAVRAQVLDRLARAA